MGSKEEAADGSSIGMPAASLVGGKVIVKPVLSQRWRSVKRDISRKRQTVAPVKAAQLRSVDSETEPLIPAPTFASSSTINNVAAGFGDLRVDEPIVDFYVPGIAKSINPSKFVSIESLKTTRETK